MMIAAAAQFRRSDMSRRLTIVILVFGAVAFAFAVPLVAHHSFAATYIEDKTETIEGDLVQFVFRNPHSFVHLECADASGRRTEPDRLRRFPSCPLCKIGRAHV